MQFKQLLKKSIKLLVLCVAAAVSAIVITLSIYLLTPLNIKPTNSADPLKLDNNNSSSNIVYYLDIPKGSSVTAVINKLSNDQVISYPKLFKFIVYIFKLENNVHAGEYELTSTMRVNNLIYKIMTGDVKQHSFVIYPGESTVSIFTRLKNNPRLDNKVLNNVLTIDYANTLTNKKLIARLLGNNVTWSNLEGVFSPDTYFYTKGDSEIDILTRAHKKLNSNLEELWNKYHKPENTIISNKYDALILASILEKEAANIKEKYLISGVAYNRLKLGMPLQLDPTVIYAVNIKNGEKFSGELSKHDLAINSPYNSYITKSLPPSPIGAVSVDSLKAAIQPEHHDYLYFVSNGEGLHQFSRTLPEHNMAVENYQKLKLKSEKTDKHAGSK